MPKEIVSVWPYMKIIEQKHIVPSIGARKEDHCRTENMSS